VGLAVVVVLGAALAGWLSGGEWWRLAELPMRDRWLVVVAALGELAGGVLAAGTGSRPAYVVGLAVGAAAALGFCLRNLRLAGVPLVAAGLVANAVVVGLNAAMPVSIVAAARAGAPIASIAAGTDPRHAIAGVGTTARALGDIVPVPLPVRPEVVSPGDVLVVAGVGELLLLGARRRGRQPDRRSLRPAAVA
jgi:hypothetical protein